MTAATSCTPQAAAQLLARQNQLEKDSYRTFWSHLGVEGDWNAGEIHPSPYAHRSFGLAGNSHKLLIVLRLLDCKANFNMHAGILIATP